MKCNHCGMEVEDGSTFCPYCGKALVDETPVETPVATPVETEPISEAPTATPVEEAAPVQNDIAGAVDTTVVSDSQGPTSESAASGTYSDGSATTGTYSDAGATTGAYSDTSAMTGTYSDGSATTGTYSDASAAAGAAQTSSPAGEKPKKKGGKTVVIVIIIIAAVLLLCCCGGIMSIFFGLGNIFKAVDSTSAETSEDITEYTIEESVSEETDTSSDETMPSIEYTTPVAQSQGLDGIAFQSSDGSVLAFSGDSFEWYLDVNDVSDNYYKGSYELYTAKDAYNLLVNDLTDYGITTTDLDEYFERNEGDDLYQLDCLVVMVLHNTDNVMDGSESGIFDSYYFGFMDAAAEAIDVASLDSGDYFEFKYLDYDAVIAAIEAAANGETVDTTDEETSEEPTDGTLTDGEYDTAADWRDLSFYYEGTLMEWPITWKDMEKLGFEMPEDYVDETLDSMYYTYSARTENKEEKSLYIQFKNYTDKDGVAIEDCDILSVGVDDFYDLPEVVLVNGITVGTSLEDVEKIMGEADYTYDSDDSSYKVREYYVDPDEPYESSIELVFSDGVVTEFTITNEE